ncbi:hypothetical protein GCM10025857_03700 [Alicyclobacillus contaminans]|nr:hypothetical protein GCM10025857_03700 [Alicyclobacillus contaminans]
MLEDIYSEFMNEVEGLRTAFEDRLASMQAAWEADRRQWQSELEALRQELAARADGAATAGAEALAERQEPTGTLSTTSSAERQNAVAEPLQLPTELWQPLWGPWRNRPSLRRTTCPWTPTSPSSMGCRPGSPTRR